MNHKKPMPAINDGAFYMETCILKISRLSLLCIVSNLELALRHPDMPKITEKETREIGRKLALRLIDDGLILPNNVMDSWFKTFGIDPVEVLAAVQESLKDVSALAIVES